MTRAVAWRLRLVWFGALFVATGCGSGRQAFERRVRELESELMRLQNDNDRLGERLTSLELARTAMAAAPAPPAADEAPVLERPPLKVIRMGPGQPAGERASDGADPESKDGAGTEEKPIPGAEPRREPARPVLRMRGKRGGVRQASGQPSQS